MLAWSQTKALQKCLLDFIIVCVDHPATSIVNKTIGDLLNPILYMDLFNYIAPANIQVIEATLSGQK